MGVISHISPKSVRPLRNFIIILFKLHHLRHVHSTSDPSRRRHTALNTLARNIIPEMPGGTLLLRRSPSRNLPKPVPGSASSSLSVESGGGFGGVYGGDEAPADWDPFESERDVELRKKKQQNRNFNKVLIAVVLLVVVVCFAVFKGTLVVLRNAPMPVPVEHRPVPERKSWGESWRERRKHRSTGVATEPKPNNSPVPERKSTETVRNTGVATEPSSWRKSIIPERKSTETVRNTSVATEPSSWSKSISQGLERWKKMKDDKRNAAAAKGDQETPRSERWAGWLEKPGEERRQGAKRVVGVESHGRCFLARQLRSSPISPFTSRC